MGGVIIPPETGRGTTYHIISVEIGECSSLGCCIHLNFTCNIVTSLAKIHLSFQIYKQGNNQLTSTPVSSVYTFFREQESSETNTFSFMAYDCNAAKNKNCSYSVIIKVIGSATVGTTSITNTILMAGL